ncbi:MAG: hypothetical protein Q4D98_05690 [Planctomycetia bacterium]|nr:hypothetical protein [Planctomycetia bacterium]
MMRYVLGMVVLLGGLVPVLGQERNPFLIQSEKFDAEYRQQLEDLSQKMVKNTKAAARIRSHCKVPHADDSMYVWKLPAKMRKATTVKKKSSAKVSPDKKRLDQFNDLKEEASLFYLALSRKAVKAGHASLGFGFLMRALRENPDNAAARKILGYKKYQDMWLSDFEIAQYKAGKTNHDRFGWIPKGHVSKYEEGQRFYRGRWISEAQDASFHADILSGWEIETPHYVITTNHSIEAGVQIGRELEKLYAVWKQLFLRYYATEKQVAALFEGKPGLSTPMGKHKVFFFRSQTDYNRYLKPTNPNIEISLGLYSTNTHVAYFFAGENYDPRTMFHEATHQLFQEIRKTDQAAGRLGNFWTIEGIAVTMETFREEDQYYAVGGFNDQRMLSARYRYNKTKFHLPLEQLAGMTTEQFQSFPKLGDLYSESAGWMNFFIFHEDGKYRDAIAQVLLDVYTGKNTFDTIPRYTGRSYEKLEEEYREFITHDVKELDRWRFGDGEE